MTRPILAVTAILCLALSGCPQQPASAEHVEPPPPAPHLTAGPDTREPPPATDRAVAEASVVGERVSDLYSDWLQGQAIVEGTQLVVFFELWCPHCRREVPRLQALQHDLGPRGLQVVGLTNLSRGVTEDQLMDFVQEQGLTYPIGRVPSGLADQLQVRGIPAAAVLRNGEVVWRGHPGRLDEATLAGWL